MRVWARVRSKMHEVYHCFMGGTCLRRGRLNTAQEHFLRALAHDTSSFRAHLSLGRIYLRQDRIGRAVEALQRAREIDPYRFAREGFPGDPLLWMAERLPESRLHQNLTVPESSGSALVLPPAGASLDSFDASRDVDELPYGDFTSQDEAERFAYLPPISLSHAEEIDWDELARDLINGE